MKPFLDTSFLIALLRKSDQHHEAAMALLPRFRGGLVTTNLVMIETLDGLAAAAVRSSALAAINALHADTRVRIVAVDNALYEEGLSLFASRSDKEWGLTDCISFIVMRREGLVDALTADRHFEQAGFRALLRSGDKHLG